MTVTGDVSRGQAGFAGFATWGIFWFVVAVLGAGLYFREGIETLLEAWKLPEYSHGPLIPVLSALLFLRQLKGEPIRATTAVDRLPGVAVILAAILMGLIGKLANIGDIVAYSLILWVGGMLLISFGWQQGKHFWPPVLHLVYMLPLPGLIYYKLSTFLQFVSSELGVQFLHWLGVSVYLEGNIIDLGVYKLHVAEACSGLRYLFPILSFSYIFAVLYRGPMWHKAVLLLSAAPITVLMNSVRIALAGYIVNVYGVEWVEGFTHFFEGWVIFIACVILLFLLARIMLFLHPQKMGLAEALDLDTAGLGAQAMRLRRIEPSAAMIAAALLLVMAAGAWQLRSERVEIVPEREPFTLFPRQIGEWNSTLPQFLESDIEKVLGADDYYQVSLARPEDPAPVGFFTAWYRDQSKGGVHSPEVCLPSAGWEIAWLERTEISDAIGYAGEFNINRAIIQKGETRMLVYYWFDQKGRKIAWDFAAKIWLVIDGVRSGRTDGALVRLTTLIALNESDAEAEARLNDALLAVLDLLPRFIPGN